MNEPGSRIYVPQPAMAGYGARIWIWRVDAEPAFEMMKLLSKWGGHDKSDGENLAWEFGPEQFESAKVYLEESGYVAGEGGLPTELLICPNCRKVAPWPTSAELGGMDRRGHYCSVACKVEYVGPPMPRTEPTIDTVKLTEAIGTHTAISGPGKGAPCGGVVDFAKGRMSCRKCNTQFSIQFTEDV